MRSSPLILSLTVLGLATLCVPRLARADGCALVVEANDLMQFNTPRLTAPAGCSEIELTLRHTGHQAVAVMGHNWVLVRRADMAAVASAGLRAGREHDYQPPADPRVLAATPLVGGGQSATIRIPVAALKPGEAYAYFCSTPGHNAIMRGEFVLGAPPRLADGGTR